MKPSTTRRSSSRSRSPRDRSSSGLLEGSKPSGLLEGSKPVVKSSAMDPTLSTFGEKFTPSTFEAEQRVKPLMRDPIWAAQASALGLCLEPEASSSTYAKFSALDGSTLKGTHEAVYDLKRHVWFRVLSYATTKVLFLYCLDGLIDSQYSGC